MAKKSIPAATPAPGTLLGDFKKYLDTIWEKPEYYPYFDDLSTHWNNLASQGMMPKTIDAYYHSRDILGFAMEVWRLSETQKTMSLPKRERPKYIKAAYAGNPYVDLFASYATAGNAAQAALTAFVAFMINDKKKLSLSQKSGFYEEVEKLLKLPPTNPAPPAPLPLKPLVLPKTASVQTWPHQVILYGAPGTGKSNSIKVQLGGVPDDRIFRVTFHPDYDYAAFVGAYKPVMNGVNIAYEFRPGIFTDAYVKANRQNEAVYLIVDEINRGNCAAIFGDIFQLLDRKNGVSEYPVNTDPDLQQHLIKCKVPNPDKLQLPDNLYIWATMNTSDQSLFPIDAAFKRRWQMKYVKNSTPAGSRNITVNGAAFNLNDVIKKINARLMADDLEDKEIGHYFLKDDELTPEALVGKLLHYLYHDVYKPYGKPEWFNDTKFNDLFQDDGKIHEKNLEDFLNKVM